MMPATTDESMSRKQEGNNSQDSGRTVTLTMKMWKAWRRAAGREIDPNSAEVTWCYAQTLDPYGVDPDLPEQ
jgi:hypothetical protein